MLILLEIILKKKPDCEGLDFEELAKNFYDHIKPRGCITKHICKYCAENKVILSDVSIPHMGFGLMMNEKNVFSMLYLFSLCKEWFDYYVLNYWDLFPELEEGRIFENKNQIIMKVLLDKVPSPARSCCSASNNQLKLYLFTQSLLCNVLDDVISEEAKVYFRHNLKIISIKEMRKIQPKKHFNIKFTTDSKG